MEDVINRELCNLCNNSNECKMQIIEKIDSKNKLRTYNCINFIRNYDVVTKGYDKNDIDTLILSRHGWKL